MMILLLLFACGGSKTAEHDEADTAASHVESDCEITWDAWGNGFFTTYCKSCHSSASGNRFDAPESVNFDDLSDVREWSARIRVRTLDEETMPVGGGVPDDELARLEAWMDCLETTE